MNLNLMTTNVCNFGCTYCYEGQFSQSLIERRALVGKATITIPEIEKFISDYEEVKGGHKDNHVISLWGGEPLLNKQFCKDVIEHFSKDPRFSFFTSTNGYYVPEYIDFFREIRNKIGKKRLNIQVSYDGDGINECTRVLKNGKNTKGIILNALKLLHDNDISYSIKSVLPSSHFKDMFTAFKDVVKYGGYYFPTPDYAVNLTPENLQEIKTSLMQIAKYIYDNNLNPDCFKWFTRSKSKCGAGVGFFSINTKKEVVGCHAAMYDNKEHIIGKIGDPDLMQNIVRAEMRYQRILEMFIESCDDCAVPFCIQCNYENYNKSPRSLPYDERWMQKSAKFCEIFKLSASVAISLKKALLLRQEKLRNNDE